MQIAIVKETSKSKLIKDCSDYDLSQSFLKIYYLIGLRKQFYPNQQEDNFLFNFIRNNYGHRNIDELYLAFEWAVKKVFEVEINPYDQFSIPYFINVFDEYKQYLKKINKETQVEKPKQIEMKEITKEEKLQDIEEYRAKDLDFKLLPLFLFDYLIQLELIDFSEQRKNDLINLAIGLREGQLKNRTDKSDRRELKEFNEMVSAGYLEGNEKTIVQNIAKRIAIKDYYNSTK